MNAVLKAADLTRIDLAELVTGFTAAPGERLRAWLEAPEAWGLAFWPGPDGELSWCRAGQEPARIPARDAIDRAVSGRLFAPSGELRWRVLPFLGERRCRCVYLGDAARAPAALADRGELRGLVRRPGKALLWGRQTERTPGEWIELRVPHRFKFPVADESAENVRAILEVWEDDFGEVHFIRLCDLESADADRE